MHALFQLLTWVVAQIHPKVLSSVTSLHDTKCCRNITYTSLSGDIRSATGGG